MAALEQRQLKIFFSGSGKNGKQYTYRHLSGNATAAQLVQFARAIEPVTDNGGSPITVRRVDTTVLDS